MPTPKVPLPIPVSSEDGHEFRVLYSLTPPPVAVVDVGFFKFVAYILCTDRWLFVEFPRIQQAQFPATQFMGVKVPLDLRRERRVKILRQLFRVELFEILG